MINAERSTKTESADLTVKAQKREKKTILFAFSHFRGCILLILCIVTLLVTSNSIAAETPPFTETTVDLGLIDTRNGDDRAIGQAWGDFDNDGWLDLYVTDTDGANSLFRNIGGQHFERVHDPAVALAEAYSGGAIFADYDNDGWQDLYVLNWGENTLLHNEQGTFVDVTETAGVGGGDKNSQTASFGDYDQDGLLDIYVANWACYGRCGRPQQGDIDRLYHNNGDGTFTNVANLLGSKTVGAGFVASFVDFDNDADLDIYLVNDEFINPIGNILWRNDGAGCEGWCFTEISKESNSNVYLMGMGLASADFDRDGFIDFHFSNAGPMQLLRNLGDGTFQNVAGEVGVEFAEGVGWGTVFLDYDNDGWQDLYVAIMDGADGSHPGNPLFHNMGNGTFEQVAMSGARDFGRSLGVAKADYNRDGATDLLLGNIDDGYHLFTNNGNDNNWIALKLIGDGTTINHNAIGSRVYIEIDDGSILMQDVTAGSSLGAGHSLIVHFGLGQSQIKRLEIRWPNGTSWQTNRAPINQLHEITYTLEHNSALKPYTPPTLFGLQLAGVIGSIIGILLFAILLIPFVNARRSDSTVS